MVVYIFIFHVNFYQSCFLTIRNLRQVMGENFAIIKEIIIAIYLLNPAASVFPAVFYRTGEEIFTLPCKIEALRGKPRGMRSLPNSPPL